MSTASQHPSFQCDIFTAKNERETLSAWSPYGLCVITLFSLENSETEPRWSGWLLPWIAGVTLLRTTGHVLEKVDSKKSERHRHVISSRWEIWKNDRETNWVFWEFIQQERNNILKEFEFGFEVEPYLEPEDYEVTEEVLEKIDLFREAVYWWRQELREIETLLLAPA